MNHWRQDVYGPLAAFASDVALEMVRHGYSPSAVRLRLWLLDGLSRWMERQALTPEQLSDEQAARFIAERRASGSKSWVSPRSVVLPLACLRSIGAVPPQTPGHEGPLDGVLREFRSYLLKERGLSVTTVSDYERWARLFLSYRLKRRGVLELDAIEGSDVLAFVRAECAGRSFPSAQHAMSAIRAFLRFLHLTGRIPTPLTGAVPSIAARRSHLPKAVPAGDVERLLASCDRQRPVGQRDFAIMMLLVRLGLRAGEVSAMHLGDVDWRAGEILVRGKGNRHDRLPLPVDVGQTLADYIRFARPRDTGPGMFARVNAPRGPLSSGGVGAVVHDACVRAGLAPIGAHRLRHTTATGMLRAGASLAEIAEVLRHRHLQSTAIYAKVDQAALRPLARPWPGRGHAS